MKGYYNVVIHRKKRKFEAGENQELKLAYAFPKEGKFKCSSVEEAASRAKKDFNEQLPNDSILLIQHIK